MFVRLCCQLSLSLVLLWQMSACRPGEDGQQATTLPETLAPAHWPAPPSLELPDSATPANNSTSAATFRYQHKNKDQLRYRMHIRQTVEVVGRDVPAARSEVRQEATVVQTVSAVEQDVATLDVALEDIKVSVTPDLPGAADDLQEALGQMRYLVRTDSRGRPLGMKPSESSDPRMRVSLQAVARQMGALAMTFPEKPVAPGSGWPCGGLVESEKDTPKGLRYETVGQCVFRGEAARSANQGRTAVIDLEANLTTSGTIDVLEVGGGLVGGGHVRGRFLFDLDRGFFVRSEVAVAARHIVVAEYRGESHRFDQTETVRVTLEWLPGPDETP